MAGFLDIPLELHHKIASYLTVDDLKSLSAVCGHFLRAYNHPLGKRTIFHVNEDTRNFGATREYFYSTRIDHMALKALSESFRNSGILIDFVRNVQLVLYRSVFESEIVDLLDAFTNLRYLDFCSSQRQFEVSCWKTLKISDYHTTIFSNIFRYFSKFEHIIAEIQNYFYSKPQMIIQEIFHNNRDTLKQVTLRGALPPEDLQKMLNFKVNLKTLILEIDSFTYAKYPNLENLLPNVKVENVELTFTIDNISICYLDLFQNITKLIINKGNIGKIHNLIGYKWIFPKLEDFKISDLGPFFFETIRAPKLKKLEIMFPITDTIEKKDVSVWKRSFPNIEYVSITVGDEKSASHSWMFSAHFFISGFLKYFGKLRKIVIRHQRVEKDYFDFMELVGRISLLKCKAAAFPAPEVDVFCKVDNYLEYWLFSVGQIRGSLDIFNRIRKHKIVNFETSRLILFEREGVLIRVFVDFV